jgi:hypothetical protein
VADGRYAFIHNFVSGGKSALSAQGNFRYLPVPVLFNKIFFS